MAFKAAPQISMKRIGVSQAQARIVGITATATFLVIFFLVASFSLFGQLGYQNRVIKAKKVTVNQLKSNITARDSLVKSYDNFADASQNFIGGSASGSGPQDGSNPKTVLDALPSTYDFPALTSSLEKNATDQKVSIESITGTDDVVAQSTGQSESDVKPVVMPFEVVYSGNYPAVQRSVDALDHWIRPIQVQQLKVTGDADKISVDVTAASYYQPAKVLNITSKVVK